MSKQITPEEFKAERERMRLTIPAMADLLGVSGRSISYYESGQKPVPLPVQKLLRLLTR